jgi:hypothetical protein
MYIHPVPEKSHGEDLKYNPVVHFVDRFCIFICNVRNFSSNSHPPHLPGTVEIL